MVHKLHLHIQGPHRYGCHVHLHPSILFKGCMNPSLKGNWVLYWYICNKKARVQSAKFQNLMLITQTLWYDGWFWCPHCVKMVLNMTKFLHNFDNLWTFIRLWVSHKARKNQNWTSKLKNNCFFSIYHVKN